MLFRASATRYISNNRESNTRYTPLSRCCPSCPCPLTMIRRETRHDVAAGVTRASRPRFSFDRCPFFHLEETVILRHVENRALPRINVQEQSKIKMSEYEYAKGWGVGRDQRTPKVKAGLHQVLLRAKMVVRQVVELFATSLCQTMHVVRRRYHEASATRPGTAFCAAPPPLQRQNRHQRIRRW